LRVGVSCPSRAIASGHVREGGSPNEPLIRRAPARPPERGRLARRELWRGGNLVLALEGVWSIRGRARGSCSIADVGRQRSRSLASARQRGPPSERKASWSIEVAGVDAAAIPMGLGARFTTGLVPGAKRARQRMSDAASRPRPRPKTPRDLGERRPGGLVITGPHRTGRSLDIGYPLDGAPALPTRRRLRPFARRPKPVARRQTMLPLDGS